MALRSVRTREASEHEHPSRLPAAEADLGGSAVARLAFTTVCAERVLPLLAEFKGEPDIDRNAVDLLWRAVEGITVDEAGLRVQLEVYGSMMDDLYDSASKAIPYGAQPLSITHYERCPHLNPDRNSPNTFP